MLTILTAAIPGREQLLAENVASVNAQTVPVHEQIIHSAPPQAVHGLRAGARDRATRQNRMLTLVTTPWVQTLADDCTLRPHHVATIMPALESSDVDVVYTRDGGPDRGGSLNVNDWPQGQIATQFDRQNFLDSDCAIRVSTLQRFGGWPEQWEGGPPNEDWELWRRLAHGGARFMCIPVITWDYRHGDWPRMHEMASDSIEVSR